MRTMKMKLLIAGTIVAGGCAMTAGAQSPDEREAARTAQIMAGRVAGEPVSCVNTRDLRGNRTIGEGDILFEGFGDTVYVNRPAGGCPDLGMGRTLVTRTTTNQLCRGDIARVVDLQSGMEYGSCGLGDFVPYRHPGRR